MKRILVIVMIVALLALSAGVVLAWDGPIGPDEAPINTGWDGPIGPDDSVQLGWDGPIGPDEIPNT